MKKLYLSLALGLAIIEGVCGVQIAKRYFQTEARVEQTLQTCKVTEFNMNRKPWTEAGAATASAPSAPSAPDSALPEENLADAQAEAAYAEEKVGYEVIIGCASSGLEKITVTGEAASSSLVQNRDLNSNTADKAVDGKMETSWQEGEEGAGVGEYLTYTLPPGTPLREITFYLGIWNTKSSSGTERDYYHMNNRPRKLTIKAGNFLEDVEFDDVREPQTLRFSEAVETDTVFITVQDVFPGEETDDTGIAEIEFYA